jgi:hypothetical protein
VQELSSLIRKLIVVPAVISLAVTLLRLLGELQRWDPRFFSRELGGAFAFVGIVWLVPVFAIYFARRLAGRGFAPESRARAMGFAALGLLLGFAAVASLSGVRHPLLRILAINLGVGVGAIVTSFGWRELAIANVAYGFAARVPVAGIMLIAMLNDWGTHYELGPPNLPRMNVFTSWLWIGLLPQLVFWISFTVVVGGVFGSLSVLIGRVRQRPAG